MAASSGQLGLNSLPFADDDATIQAFYANVVPNGVAVKSGAVAGKGVFATEAFETGATILDERPLVSMQTLDSRHEVVACAHCLRPVGSAQLQLLALTGQVDPVILARSTPESIAELTSFPMHSTGDPKLADFIHCQLGCGDLFCSKECHDAAMAGYHFILCSGPIKDASHPLIQFKLYAMEHNEAFIMAAKVIASICQEAARNGGDVLAAALPYNLLQRQGPWWDVALTPQGKNAKDFKKKLEKSVLASFKLLKDGLAKTIKARSPVPVPASLLDAIINVDFYASLLGAFELNTVGVVMRSILSALSCVPGLEDASGHPCPDTLENLLAMIANENEEEGGEDGDGEGGEGDDDGEEDEDDDDDACPCDDPADEELKKNDILDEGVKAIKNELAANPRPDGWLPKRLVEVDPEAFPPLDATALFSTICCLNHSCVPNARIVYGRDGRCPLVAHLIALRPIASGEEVFISYTKASATLSERREALLNYGFLCNCPKCLEEEKEGIQPSN